MAKCRECRSCMRIVRVDREPPPIIVWYCPLCQKGFTIVEREPIADEELILVKQRYNELRGTRIE